jgi:hypothetical protein
LPPDYGHQPTRFCHLSIPRSLVERVHRLFDIASSTAGWQAGGGAAGPLVAWQAHMPMTTKPLDSMGASHTSSAWGAAGTALSGTCCAALRWQGIRREPGVLGTRWGYGHVPRDFPLKILMLRACQIVSKPCRTFESPFLSFWPALHLRLVQLGVFTIELHRASCLRWLQISSSRECSGARRHVDLLASNVENIPNCRGRFRHGLLSK